MSKHAEFKVGDKVCHKKQGLGVGTVKMVLRDHSYTVDFGKKGVFKLHDDALEPAGRCGVLGVPFGVPTEMMLGQTNAELRAEPSKINDNVNHPRHYCENGENECIEIMRWLFGDEAVKAYCRCVIFKYRFRQNLKNGKEDIDKSVWYENYLRNMLNAESLFNREASK